MNAFFDNRIMKLNASEVETLVNELHQCACRVASDPKQVQYNLVIMARNISDAFADDNNMARMHEVSHAPR